MTYEELVAKMQGAFKTAKAKGVEHTAIEFDIRGEGEGALYMEIRDGKIDVQPYEYFDRDYKVEISAEDFIAVCEGRISLAQLTGDEALASVKPAAKKAAAATKAKAEPKKTEAKKTATKKPAEKKTAAKKTSTKSTSTKK